MTIELGWRLIFEILIIHKPSLGSCEVPHKTWARLVQTFIGYKQTYKQTHRKSKNIYRFTHIFWQPPIYLSCVGMAYNSKDCHCINMNCKRTRRFKIHGNIIRKSRLIMSRKKLLNLPKKWFLSKFQNVNGSSFTWYLSNPVNLYFHNLPEI